MTLLTLLGEAMWPKEEQALALGTAGSNPPRTNYVTLHKSLNLFGPHVITSTGETSWPRHRAAVRMESSNESVSSCSLQGRGTTQPDGWAVRRFSCSVSLDELELGALTWWPWDVSL